MTNLDYKHYIIEMASNNNFVQYSTVQGDGNNVRGFEVELIQNGVPYVIDTDDTIVAITGTKPDGTQIFNECSVTSEGYILVDVTSQMSAVKGKSDYSITLMSRSTNSQLKSFPFHIIVTPAAFDIDYLVSSDEFQLLTKNITQAEELIAEGTDALTDLRALETTVSEAENERNDAEASRAASEQIRVQNETKRTSAEALRRTNSATAIENANSATASATEAAERANAAAELCEDIASGYGVIGVKGENETEYRSGNVSLSASDVGALTLYSDYKQLLGDVEPSASMVTLFNLRNKMAENSYLQMDIYLPEYPSLGLPEEIASTVDFALLTIQKNYNYDITCIHDAETNKSYILKPNGDWFEIADANHNHDDVYDTKSETSNKFAWKTSTVSVSEDTSAASVTLYDVTDNTEISIYADINPNGINDNTFGSTDSIVLKIPIVVYELKENKTASFRSGYYQNSDFGHGISFKVSRSSANTNGGSTITITFEYLFFNGTIVTNSDNVDWKVHWRLGA